MGGSTSAILTVGDTLGGGHTVPTSWGLLTVCHSLRLSTGRTYDLLLTNRIWQTGQHYMKMAASTLLESVPLSALLALRKQVPVLGWGGPHGRERRAAPDRHAAEQKLWVFQPRGMDFCPVEPRMRPLPGQATPGLQPIYMMEKQRAQLSWAWTPDPRKCEMRTTYCTELLSVQNVLTWQQNSHIPHSAATHTSFPPR